MSITVKIVMTAIKGGRVIKKQINLLIFFGYLIAGGNSDNQTSGAVSYITVENVYCDLGSENGLAIGDTLHVLRRNDEIGLLVVQSTGRKSSVTHPLIPSSNFQLGDLVIFIPKQKSEVPEEPIEKEVASKKEEPPIKKQKKKPIFDHGGSISLRGNWNKYNSGSNNERLLGNLNLRLGITSPIKNRLWIYGHNNFTENTFRLYQLRLELGDRTNQFYGQIGRLYVSELAGVGAVDGVMVSVGKNRKNRVGAMAGFQPTFLETKFNSDVKKISAFSANEWEKGKRVFKLNAALVGQYAKNKIDREFMYIRMNLREGSNYELSWYETVDLYRDSTVYNRSSIEPISSQISFRFRLGNMLTFNSRLSSRKQVLYRQSGTLLPDTLFVDELRSGWYNSIQVRSKNWGTFRLNNNLRIQANSSDLSQVTSVGYTAPRLKNNLYLTFSSSFIKNMLITGFRNRVSASKSLNDKGSIFADYDLYVYGFGNQLADYTRHAVSFGINYRIMKKLSTNGSIDISKDGEFSAIYVYSGLSYRF